jgi:shikimate 5-dehydrogenase
MHSLSPVDAQRRVRRCRDRCDYVRCRRRTSLTFLAFAERSASKGCSVTIPFKLDALRAATVDALTRTVGRRTRCGRWRGWEATNTDVAGSWRRSRIGSRAHCVAAGRPCSGRAGRLER